MITTATVVAGSMVYRLYFAGGFKAVSSVIVDPRGINSVSGASTQAPGTEGLVLGTYANVARSPGTARRVIAELPDHLRRALERGWRDAGGESAIDFESWAASKLAKNVDVRPGGQSSHVLDIGVTAQSSADAAALANLYARVMMNFSRDSRVSAARTDADYFQTQANSLRAETEAAEQRLANFQRQHGFTSSDGRTDLETEKLTSLTSRAMINEDLSSESALRARQASNPSSSPDIVGNPVVQRLTADLATKEAQLQRLSARYGESHPELIGARSDVEQARSALAREARKVIASLGSSSRSADSRAAVLRSDSEQQRQKVMQMNALRVDLSALDKDVGQKRKLYEAAVQRSAEARLEAGSHRSDLLLLAEAFPSKERAGPGVAVLIPLSALVGLMLGTLMALILERYRPRFHSVFELEELGLPVLQVVPVVALAIPGTKRFRSKLLCLSF